MTRSILSRLYHDCVGGTAIEYGLIAAIIVIGMLTALSGLANQISVTWNTVSSQTSSAVNQAAA